MFYDVWFLSQIGNKCSVQTSPVVDLISRSSLSMKFTKSSKRDTPLLARRILRVGSMQILFLFALQVYLQTRRTGICTDK